MKHLIFILIPVLLFSCKSPQKMVSDLKQKEDIAINNDITVSDDKHLFDLTEKIMQRITKDRMNIGIKNTKYDTDKPADPITGKHPVKEENEININKQTDVQETESIHHEKDSVSSVQTQDHSQIKAKTEIKTKEEKESGLKWWQKMFIAIGIVSVCLIITIVINAFTAKKYIKLP
ncbi:MAG: hypothetical protein LBV43_04890 [Prevotella sp.]|jgi:hypothetical protein|nr:hypothetical protein [Prevotella sp.]